MKLKVVDGREAIPEDAENMRRCFAIVDCPRIIQGGLEVTLRFNSQGDEGRPDTNLIATFSPEDTQVLQGKYPNISEFKSVFVYLGQNQGYLEI
jgi:hypothetical protein